MNLKAGATAMAQSKKQVKKAAKEQQQQREQVEREEKEDQDALLDEALKETFPASDPIAVPLHPHRREPPPPPARH